MTKVIPLPLPTSAPAPGLSWCARDVMVAGGIAFALDLSQLAVPSADAVRRFKLSELVRDANVSMQRSETPTLRLAWAFCQAARVLADYDDCNVSPQARSLGCRIAAAALPLEGFTPVDVIYAAFGSLGSYVAIGKTAAGGGAAIEERDETIVRYFELTDAGRELLPVTRAGR